MRKKLILMFVPAIVLLGIIAHFILNDQKNLNLPQSNSPVNANSAKTKKIYKNACDVLTLDLAKKILGSGAILDNINNIKAADTADIQLSSCYYSLGNRDTSLLVRAAKTDAGALNNQNQFSINGLPAGSVFVDAYGDSAFWNPQLGQFNILKRNNWYILSFGSIPINGRTLEDAKTMANLIITKL